jgi:hypothetical protein
MFADLILYTEPVRPVINPMFDLFAFLDLKHIPPILPAKVVDHVELRLPEKCKEMDFFPDDIWDFILWQTEEKGYTVVRYVDSNWLYWALLVNKLKH